MTDDFTNYFGESNNYCEFNSGKYLEALKKYHENIRENAEKSLEKCYRFKLIYIYNSSYQYPKIPDKKSAVINGRNPLNKDDLLIDYDKDSEDEFLEENAEDIGEEDNDDKEEIEEEELSKSEEKFIVPDGHLSEEEVSDKDAFVERQIFEESKDKIKGIKDLLQIRKNYSKPIIINFQQNNNCCGCSCNLSNNGVKDTTIDSSVYKVLLDALTIKIFNVNNLKKESIVEEQEKFDLTFPLKIRETETRKQYEGIEECIYNHLEDIVGKIHGNFEPRERLINEICDEFKEIPKKSLKNFILKKCVKLEGKDSKKKYYYVKKEVLDVAGISEERAKQMIDQHLNEFKQKEEERLKELAKIKAENDLKIKAKIEIGENEGKKEADIELIDEKQLVEPIDNMNNITENNGVKENIDSSPVKKRRTKGKKPKKTSKKLKKNINPEKENIKKEEEKGDIKDNDNEKNVSQPKKKRVRKTDKRSNKNINTEEGVPKTEKEDRGNNDKILDKEINKLSKSKNRKKKKDRVESNKKAKINGDKRINSGKMGKGKFISDKRRAKNGEFDNEIDGRNQMKITFFIRKSGEESNKKEVVEQREEKDGKEKGEENLLNEN